MNKNNKNDDNSKNRQKIKRVAFTGLMLAIIIVLSAVEQMLPPLPMLPPTMKLGLSNIITMYCVFFVSRTQAVMLNAAKSFFVLLTRGPIAAALSFCGGMVSIGVIIVLIVIFREKISYLAVSVFGAIAHNIGQFAAVSVILYSPNIGYYYLYYLPVLLVSGIIMGIITGTLLRVVMPAFNSIRK
ncbi:MAG: Gx transporter family protein [Oscillospiraceae bacterium]|nr:Gx transporter family protein [Oscillospiraceae bacterium]